MNRLRSTFSRGFALCTLALLWSPGLFSGESDSSYQVVHYRCENFDQCEVVFGDGRVQVVDPSDLLASPFGWHDIDGSDGAEFTVTRGNNVSAQEDLDANNAGGFQPDGGKSLVFDFPFDPNLDPEDGTNLSASIVNLFYLSNVLHDLAYRYGFDEAAGNFQENNYGSASGLEGDAMQADALDGMSTNTSTFFNPPDGIPPRLEMHRWLAPTEILVESPPDIAGDYSGGRARFGPELDQIGVGGELEYVDDGVIGGAGGSIRDACEPLVTSSLDGLVALIDRGFCEFGTKVLNAENAGAVAALIVNDQQLPNGVITMSAGVDGGSVTIPSAMLGNADGQLVRDRLPIPGVAATLRKVLPDRDGAFDNGLIAHAYAHGIVSRLAGGPSNPGCTSGTEQASEGWCDFWTMILSSQPTDSGDLPRSIGTYVLFHAADGPGLRNHPYSTDLAINPLTYGDIATTNIPHGVGEVWMSMLWEMYWQLVDKHGFADDLFGGFGGNTLALQLVIDGLKLQPCNPTFVGSRDAIMLADQVNNGGANQCEIWRAFAKRGLGLSASAGTIDVGDEVEAFDLPAECAGVLFGDDFESGDCAAWSSTDC